MGIALAPGQADPSPASVTYAVDATKADSLIGRVAVDDSSNPDARPVILQASRLSLARVHCWPSLVWGRRVSCRQLVTGAAYAVPCVRLYASSLSA